MQDAVDSISSSSKSEKSKIEDLKRLNNKLSEFIETAARKDSAAESEIKKSKEDFYTKYSYLKPECEKSPIEHICDGVQSAADWCKEHWKFIATVVRVAVAVVLLCTGVGSGLGAEIIAGACWGAILGACIGGVSGGVESVANGGSFLEGFEDGALSGAISGAIGGAAFAGLGQLGAVAGKGIKCMSGFGKKIPETITQNGRTRVGYDGDHYPTTWSERVQEMKKWPTASTRKQVLDIYNQDVRAQCPNCNQGHMFEGVKGDVVK